MACCLYILTSVLICSLLTEFILSIISFRLFMLKISVQFKYIYITEFQSLKHGDLSKIGHVQSFVISNYAYIMI